MKRKTFQWGAVVCLVILFTNYSYGQQSSTGPITCGAQVPAAHFKAQRGVGAGVKDFPFDLKYVVVSYTFTINTDDGDIISENVVGNAFSGRVRQIIDTHVKPGKMVTIENIRVKGEDGRTSTVPALIFYII